MVITNNPFNSYVKLSHKCLFYLYPPGMVGSDEKGRFSSTTIKGLPWHTNASQQRKLFHTEHNQEGEPPRVLITGT